MNRNELPVVVIGAGTVGLAAAYLWLGAGTRPLTCSWISRNSSSQIPQRGSTG